MSEFEEFEYFVECLRTVRDELVERLASAESAGDVDRVRRLRAVCDEHAASVEVAEAMLATPGKLNASDMDRVKAMLVGFVEDAEEAIW